jgi:hypothetical protein
MYILFVISINKRNAKFFSQWAVKKKMRLISFKHMRGLISLWLYKENKQWDWKNVFTLHIPLWAPHTYNFVLTSLNHPKKKSFGCAANRKIGNSKSQRLISTPTYYLTPFIHRDQLFWNENALKISVNLKIIFVYFFHCWVIKNSFIICYLKFSWQYLSWIVNHCSLFLLCSVIVFFYYITTDFIIEITGIYSSYTLYYSVYTAVHLLNHNC